VLVGKAQEGAKAGQAKLSDLQAKRHADSLLLEIGGIVYTEKVGRGGPDTDAKIRELVDQLRELESEHGPVTVTIAGAIVPEGSSASPGGPQGDATE
jgi:hypothetical protein